MNILSFTNCTLDSRLGSGKTVLNYSKGLRELGHDLEVYEPNDFRLWPKMRWANKARTGLGAWFLLRKKLRAKRIDLLECYGDEFAFSIASAARQKERPFIVAHTNGLEMLASERERAYAQPKGLLASGPYLALLNKSHDYFSRLTLTHADAFVALCELDRKFVVNLGLFPVERTAVVEPGLDVEYLSAPLTDDRDERVAFTGSWTTRKGVDILASVMTRLLTQRSGLRLDILGAGVAPQTVLGNFPEKTWGRIEVHPRITEKEIAETLVRSKVFFFPTQYEGFGIALAEAMACGCAGVTTRTGFGAELKDGEEAILCDFDDPRAMTVAVERLLDDDDLRLRIARNAWQRTRSLTWRANVCKLEAIYSDWAAQHQQQK